jgi:hypothetical protein
MSIKFKGVAGCVALTTSVIEEWGNICEFVSKEWQSEGFVPNGTEEFAERFEVFESGILRIYVEVHGMIDGHSVTRRTSLLIAPYQWNLNPIFYAFN